MHDGVQIEPLKQDPGLSISPTFEQRRARYVNNLDRLDTLTPDLFYPPEVIKRQWEEVQDSPDLEDFMKNFSQYDTNDSGRFGKRLMGVYRDKKTRKMFAAPSFPGKTNAREIILDMLAATSDLAPYSHLTGLKIINRDTYFQPNAPSIYTFHGGMIAIVPIIIENFINGLGDEQYSNNDRRALIIEEISRYLHETVHMHNEQDLNPGGQYGVLCEIASTTAQYLAFPGKNDEMEKRAANAIRFIKGEKVESRYDQALLYGMILSAQNANLLPEIDDKEGLIESLSIWRHQVGLMSRGELEETRRRLEDKYWLSEQDRKLVPALLNLKEKYPVSLDHLPLLSWEYLK